MGCTLSSKHHAPESATRGCTNETTPDEDGHHCEEGHDDNQPIANSRQSSQSCSDQRVEMEDGCSSAMWSRTGSGTSFSAPHRPIHPSLSAAYSVTESLGDATETPPPAALVLPDEIGFTPTINGRNGWDFANVYTVDEELGHGAFGKVYLVSHRHAVGKYANATWAKAAIKKTKPNALDLQNGRVIETYGQLERRCQEVKTLQKLQGVSPHLSPVLFLFEVYMASVGRGNCEFYMITELLCQELDEWRSQQEHFTEKMAIDVSRSVLDAIDYMHSRNVVHRDIKMQNIMFRVPNDCRSLKIVDFGLAKVLEEQETARDFCGSVGYIAPEIYNNEAHRFEVDMFAFGVMLFRLISKERPFASDNFEILKKQTIELRYNVQSGDWGNVSVAAKDLIRKLLIGRRQRVTAQQALSHRWFQELGLSVLPSGHSTVCGLHEGDGRSEALIRSQAPVTATLMRSESRFWVDQLMQVGLITLISADLYFAHEITEHRRDESGQGLIYMEETTPPECLPFPEFIRQSLGTYSEFDCRFVCLRLALAIKTMHDAGIAHRNLNMENVVMDPMGNVKLQGFRFAQPIVEGVPLTGHFGYQYSWYAFKAPEVDNEFVHDKAVDLWSLGAIMYTLLTGVAPFRGNGIELVERKRTGQFEFDFVTVSQPAEALVRNLLQVQPEMRYTIEDVLKDRWMNESQEYLERFSLDIALDGFRDWRET